MSICERGGQSPLGGGFQRGGTSATRGERFRGFFRPPLTRRRGDFNAFSRKMTVKLQKLRLRRAFIACFMHIHSFFYKNQ